MTSSIPSPLSSDLLVVELGERLAVAACGSVLAELGATVVMVEPSQIDNAMASTKWRHRVTMAAGKMSVSLGSAHDGDADMVAALIGKADAVVVSSDVDRAWPPAVADVLARAPIVCDITAFGDGQRGERYSDGMMQAVTGTMDITGDPDQPPTPSAAPILDMTTGNYAASGILLALEARRQVGVTQSISVTLFDCALSMMTTFLPKHFTGGEPHRVGNHHTSLSPWNAYRAKDGWVLVCSGSNDQWARLANLIGHPELTQDPRFATTSGRVHATIDVDLVVEAWASQHTVDACLTMLNAATIPCGPVVEVAQLFTDASLLHRGMVQSLNDPQSGKPQRIPGAVFRGTRSRGVSPHAIPKIAADGAAVTALLAKRTMPKAGIAGTATSGDAVLAGLRVLEIGQYTTAPLTSRQLAAFGADVVKIEPPTGDPARGLPPHRDGQSYFFTLSNADKRGIVIDLRKDAHKALFTELVLRADVLVENMKPGALSRFGFSPDRLAALNPRLVYCAVSGFGADSPNASRGAMDTTIQGMSGIMDLTRTDGVPFKTGISIADLVGGQFALAGILAALSFRERTGKGQFIDLSMQDAAAWILRTAWNGECDAIPQLIECRDGFAACELQAESAAKELASLGKNLTRQELSDQLGERGIGCVPVQTLGEVITSPQAKAREVVVQGFSPEGAEWPLLGPPIRLSATPARVRRAMGALGCDTDSILRDWKIGDWSHSDQPTATKSA